MSQYTAAPMQNIIMEEDKSNSFSPNGYDCTTVEDFDENNLVKPQTSCEIIATAYDSLKGRKRIPFGSHRNECSEEDTTSTTNVSSDIKYIIQLAKMADKVENRSGSLLSVFDNENNIDDDVGPENHGEITGNNSEEQTEYDDEVLIQADSTPENDYQNNHSQNDANEMCIDNVNMPVATDDPQLNNTVNGHLEEENEAEETRLNDSLKPDVDQISQDEQASEVITTQNSIDTNPNDISICVRSVCDIETVIQDDNQLATDTGNHDDVLDHVASIAPISSISSTNHIQTPEKPLQDLIQSSKSEGLDDEAVLASTDKLFAQVTDKLSVTVKDIIQSLCTEFNVKKLTKALKATVRQRLIQLIEQEQNDADQEDEGDDQGADSETEGSESEISVNDQLDDDFELDQEQRTTGRRRKEKKKAGKLRKKGSPTEKAPKINVKTKKSAMRIHQEQLRKRRLEELRIRNEELQAVASKQDQERAERIAAKFDTNREDLRLQRLENRLDLLHKLDQKRISCVIAESTVVTNEGGNTGGNESPLDVKNLTDAKPKLQGENAPDTDKTEESSEDEDSEDELQIVGGKGFGNKLLCLQSSPLKKPQNRAMSLLDLADQSKLRIPVKLSSPGRNINARAQLRLKLLSKQRRLGNDWLARELGYKSHEDHLRDCQKTEERKRETIRKREEERVKSNERKLLRERLLKVEEAVQYEPEDDDDESYNPDGDNVDNNIDGAEDDDEEMQLAKALEEESARQEESEIADNDNNDASDRVEEIEDSNFENTMHAVEEEQKTEENDELEVISTDGNNDNASGREFQSKITNNAMNKIETPELPSDALGSSLLDVSEESDKNHDAAADDVVDHKNALESDESSVASKADDEEENTTKPKGPRNSAYRAMLEKEEKDRKKKKKNGLIEEEADEEEEEHVVGLEDFGFTVAKKKSDDDDDDDADYLNEDDLKHVVDDLSDDEGDEEAGEKGRKEMEEKEEKDRHKAMLRRMRDGYDGRRGGIAVGTGARGLHRFDQLVAADNKEDAKRLGLLNDDELDSDGEEKNENADNEDEAALIDKMLKDRFLHRNPGNADADAFSDDDEVEETNEEGIGTVQDEEELQQERLAKRFAKRARMQRILEAHEHEEEFSQLRLMDEDTTLKLELQNMKVRNCDHACCLHFLLFLL